MVAGDLSRQSLLAVRAGSVHSPSVDSSQLPGALLGRLTGDDLIQRLCQLLRLLIPITTGSWSGYLKVVIDPQKM